MANQLHQKHVQKRLAHEALEHFFTVDIWRLSAFQRTAYPFKKLKETGFQQVVSFMESFGHGFM